jgi:hypothetical protein
MNHQTIEHQQIQGLAFRLWQERGSPPDSPEVDWFAAEDQLRRLDPSRLPFSSISMGPTQF